MVIELPPLPSSPSSDNLTAENVTPADQVSENEHSHVISSFCRFFHFLNRQDDIKLGFSLSLYRYDVN